ncbi:hypothetical protein ACLGCJ_02290 [Helicobacter pylori]
MGVAVVLFLTLVLLFLVLRDFGLASPKQKLVAFVIVGIIGASISVYTYQQNQQNQQEIALQRAFLRGETLLCKGIKVNNQTFNLVRSGTLSFLGKKQTPMKDVLVDLDSCQTLQKDPLIQPQ